MAEARGARVLLVAGEASGDLHGGHLIQELQKQCPGVKIAAVGGDHLRACGVEILADVRLLSAAGLVEIVSSLRRHYRVMQLLKHQMDHHRPDVVVLVDYPGFNLFVAKEAKKRGIPVFFYIAPQVWAWGKGRAKKMSKMIDRLAVIFPFEETIFNRHGRSFARYVGHPLVDELAVTRSVRETRDLYGLDHARPVLALMPGSRRSEVLLLLPEMAKACWELMGEGWQVVLIKAPTIELEYISKLCDWLPREVKCVEYDAYNILAASDVGLVASGTATLQASLLGCPPVIVYKFSWLTYVIAKLFISHRVLGLPNVILGRSVFPELIQRKATAANMISRVRWLFGHRSEIASSLHELSLKMGDTGASSRAASLLAEMFR